ncbi:hypothetical protein ACSDR0_25030 [Streptosporangium sp. G11]|uniref:hypothetical protein n=1 Tax=Streptosporangium sp. G11 TaxID=3436926 RepID=UPI003EBEE260
MPPTQVTTYTHGMGENAFEVPLDEADGHLPDVISAAAERNAIAYLTDHGRRVAAIVPADEAWYWTSGWQSAEAEADADTREGRVRTFDSTDDMFAEIDAVRGDDPR